MDVAGDFERNLLFSGNDPVSVLKEFECQYLSLGPDLGASHMSAKIVGYCQAMDRSLQQAELLLRSEGMRTRLMAVPWHLHPTVNELLSLGSVPTLEWRGVGKEYALHCTFLYRARLQRESGRWGYLSEEDNFQKLQETGLVTE